MRKTLSIVLSVLMVLSIVTLGISAAPEGEAIKTAADFAAMKEDGKYYLDNDLVINASYDKAFKGVLDGNGHSVTISCPLFEIVEDAVIKNLTINGAIKSNNAPAAAVAVRVVDNIEIYDVVNNAPVEVTGNHQGLYAAGFVATTNVVDQDNELWFDGKQPARNTHAMCKIINSKNTGEISVILEGIPETDPDTSKEGDYRIQESTVKPRAGGFVAVGQSYVMVDCENTGNVTCLGASSSIAGGLVARGGLHADVQQYFFINCKNTGDVKSNSYSGGMIGYNGTKSASGTAYMYGCINTGTIEGPSFCGGIIGYMYATGSNSTAYCDMEFCVNTGKLRHGRPLTAEGATQTSYVSGWIAYTNSIATVISYNIDTGEREAIEGATPWGSAIVAVSSADTNQYIMDQNYVLDPNGAITFFSDANSAENRELNQHPISEAGDKVIVLKDDSKLKSGEVAYLCNEASGGELNAWFVDSDPAEINRIIEFYQKIGVDELPSTVAAEGSYVVLQDGKYVNGAKAEATTAEPTTKAQTTAKPIETTAPETEAPTQAEGTEAHSPETTTKAPEVTTAPKSSGGCGSVVGIGVAVVALMGAAFVAKKKF